MVNVLRCSLSPWTGDPEKCRWCNDRPSRGSGRFCSRECTAAYANNHYYARGRNIVGDASRGECDCPDPITPLLGYFDGERVRYLQFKKPHRICAGCGECEEAVSNRGDRLTCNHIDPRNGISMSEANCIHHMENLEILCWHDHALLNRLGNVRERLTRALEH